MKVLLATMAATTLAGLAVIYPAEARCFWNGFDMECHYPVRPPTVHYYREVEPYDAPQIIQREVIERRVQAPPAIYDDWP